MKLCGDEEMAEVGVSGLCQVEGHKPPSRAPDETQTTEAQAVELTQLHDRKVLEETGKKLSQEASQEDSTS